MSEISCDLSVSWLLTILLSLYCHTLHLNFNGKMNEPVMSEKTLISWENVFHITNPPRTWLACSHLSSQGPDCTGRALGSGTCWLPAREDRGHKVRQERASSSLCKARNSSSKSRMGYFQKLWEVNSCLWHIQICLYAFRQKHSISRLDHAAYYKFTSCNI